MRRFLIDPLKYFEKANKLLANFDDVTLEYIPRMENFEANALAQIASDYKNPNKYFDEIMAIQKFIIECNYKTMNINTLELRD